MTLLIFAVFCVLSYALGYYVSKYDQEDEVSFEYMKSELADPSVNFPPIWFEWPHYQILEVLKDWKEMSRKDINTWLGKSKHHAYERKLWLGEYVTRRVKKTEYGRVHYYTITPKGKEALEKYANKF